MEGAFVGGSLPLGDGGGDDGDQKALSQGKGHDRRDGKRFQPRRLLLQHVRRLMQPQRSVPGTCASDDVDLNEHPGTTWRRVAKGNLERHRNQRAADREDDETQDMPIG